MEGEEMNLGKPGRTRARLKETSAEDLLRDVLNQCT